MVLASKEATNLPTGTLVVAVTGDPIFALPHIGWPWDLLVSWVLPIKTQPIVDEGNPQVHLESVAPPVLVNIPAEWMALLLLLLVNSRAIHNVLDDAMHGMDNSIKGPIEDSKVEAIGIE